MPTDSVRPRGLERRLRSTWTAVPVVILEGGRAVGKTTLCRQLQRSSLVNEIADLTDPDTRRAAAADPSRFVRQLRHPAVIDEAQLVPELSLAVKQRVDELRAPGLFLLTGSARIGRGALGGTDPLAGRAVRLRLGPLTQGERSGRPFDLTPALRTGDFRQHRFEGTEDIVERLVLGGLPIVPGVTSPSGSPAVRREVLGSYLDSVVHLTTGPAPLDRTRLLNLFRAVAGVPSLILNIEKLASDLGLASSTVRSNLEYLYDTFLLDRVPALAADARREIKGHPRLVPFDVALGTWAGRQTVDRLRADATAIGPLLQTLVLNELITQSAWSERAEIFHWRLRDDEVDAVLRFQDGAMVAVEIKAARALNRHDANGIRAFRRRAGQSPHGVIFYLGDLSYELEPGIWALPVRSLWDGAPVVGNVTEPSPTGPLPLRAPRPVAEGRGTAEQRGTEDAMLADEDHVEELPSGAALFLSYVQADDDAVRGRIVGLAQDLGQQYRLLTGEEIQTFTDRDMRWGEEWQSRIDQQLARTTFFVPVVTPRYLRSTACRREAETFLAAARTTGVDRYVLPIFLVEPEQLDESDPIGAALKTYQGAKWQRFRYADRDARDYLEEIGRLAQRLADAVASVREAQAQDGMQAAVTGSDRSSETSAEERGDILALMESAETSMDRLPSELARYQEAFEHVLAVLSGSFDLHAGSSGRSARELRAVLRTIAAEIHQPVDELNAATTELEAELRKVDAIITELLRRGRSDEADTFGVGSALADLRDHVPDDLGIDVAQIQTARDQMRALGRLATEMQAPTRSIERALLVVTDVSAMLQRWRQETTTAGR